jgi:hypothetical protein
MELLKPLIKEKRLCRVLMNDIELDGWLAVDINTTHYIICETTTRWSCWVVPKMLLNSFMRQFYRRAEKFEVTCP